MGPCCAGCWKPALSRQWLSTMCQSLASARWLGLRLCQAVQGQYDPIKACSITSEAERLRCQLAEPVGNTLASTARAMCKTLFLGDSITLSSINRLRYATLKGQKQVKICMSNMGGSANSCRRSSSFRPRNMGQVRALTRAYAMATYNAPRTPSPEKMARLPCAACPSRVHIHTQVCTHGLIGKDRPLGMKNQ